MPAAPGKIRIIGGHLRNSRIDVPDRPGLRPTPERVRETLFNWLTAHVGGARVLDLFAGTGALGLEALSRGAARVAFVDDGTAARALLRRNIELMQAMGVTDVWRRDATRMGPNRGAGFDLIFLDPPYGKGLGEASLASCREGGWIAPGALVVWEEGTVPLVPEGFDLLDQRKYGDTLVTILRAEEGA